MAPSSGKRRAARANRALLAGRRNNRRHSLPVLRKQWLSVARQYVASYDPQSRSARHSL